ncbi:FAD-dependent oxidoreductase [Arcobacter porcinus]|uniref:Bifunctional tRNA (Mnm(5)s(2)U34)-methyltransferase/FAD-dependent cmnm(5)s(2)U34 oxidoreductase n=1 Tax=Arcobacter porcinus TaxID=1935204 RepID=A0ABX2YAI5_9BACT|nr:FAD-dependent oxidoreductase [Arcobacter porcinus]OCL90345.1 bifunctional tRNA (mnm(5)s(2)U34)-methyltransferase/FAD-dependent cmnm(5)s(2)U34 oxidoreductase [Arcobacter porcinus]
MKKYDYIIIGAGIAGCSLAYSLSKYSKSVLIIDKNSDIAFGASGAAGAFLSPLLGVDNSFKTLVARALEFSSNIYKKEFPDLIDSCGTLRIPKDKNDEDKFQNYIPFMDFSFEARENGYFFPIGSSVKSYEICKELSKNVEKLLSYEATKIEQIKDDKWIINSEFEASKLFLATGANISLIEEDYFKIRAVWGQKIDILSSSQTFHNYHKECSISNSKEFKNRFKISIGATHDREELDKTDTSFDLSLKDINLINHNEKTKNIIDKNSQKLLKLASDIKTLEDIEIIDIKIGARASSVDYFPMLAELIDVEKSVEKYPHIKNGSFIKDENLETIKNLYTLNGVGGRGFVLSLYLADILVEYVINGKEIDSSLTNHRLFKRWIKRLNNKGKNR